MTVREFLRVVWDGRWYVLGAVAVVAVAAWWYVGQQVVEFQAQAEVRLEQVVIGPEPVLAGDDPDIVTSPAVTEDAAARLDVEVDEIPGVVEAGYSAESRTMYVQVVASTADEAVDVANAYAEAYVAALPALIEAEVNLLDEQIDAVSVQIGDAREVLEDDEDDPVAGALEQSGAESISSLTTTRTSYLTLVRPGSVSTPALSAETVGPEQTMVLLVALLAGLVAGIGLAFARYGLDPRLRTSGEVAGLTETSVLARLAGTRRAMRDAERRRVLPAATHLANPFTESVRELRTVVQVSLGGSDGAIVVSSADPRAPRAFVAANLAVSFALSGRRTVLLEGDVRRPQIEGLLPPPDGWTGPRGQLRPSAVPNLQVCRLPDTELDPADYLASQPARELVEAVRRQADMVIVHAPPIVAAADATILGSYTDGVVVVAEERSTDRGVLAECAERLRANSVRLIGVALVGPVRSKRAAYAATYGTADHRDPKDPGAGDEAAEPAKESLPWLPTSRRDGTGRDVLPVPIGSVSVPERPVGDERAERSA